MIVTELFRSSVVAEAFEMPIVTGFLNPATGRPFLPSELAKSTGSNFAGPGKVTTSFKSPTAAPAGTTTSTVPNLTSAPAKVKPLATTTAGKAEPLSIGGQKINPDEPLYTKIMQNVSAGSSTAANPPPYLAAAENTAIKNITDIAVNMLRTAQSKGDLAKVKTYIDREFAKQGNKYISEAMFFYRDRLIKHAVQIFQRRIL